MGKTISYGGFESDTGNSIMRQQKWMYKIFAETAVKLDNIITKQYR